jgi:hypothetical protein
LATLSYFVELPGGAGRLDVFGAQPVTKGDPTVLDGTVKAADFLMRFDGAAKVPSAGTPTLAPVELELVQGPEVKLKAIARIAWVEAGKLHLDGLTEISLPGGTYLGMTLNPSVVEFAKPLGREPWRVDLHPVGVQAGETKKPVATIDILGVEFSVDKLSLNASGIVEADARFELQKEIVIPGLNGVRVLSANVTLAGQQAHASLRLSFAFDYFVGAKGELEMEASRGPLPSEWEVAATTRVNSGATWTDPSGWLSFGDMGVELDVGREDGKVAVRDIRTSGQVTFRADALEAKSREWLSDLFSGLSTEFRNVSLRGAGAGPAFGFSFRPRGGLQIKALDIFDLHIPELKVEQRMLTLRNPAISLNMGSASLRGRIEELKISLAGSPSIQGVDAFTIEMALSAPGGVKASATMHYEHTETVQTVSGTGQLTTPTFPGVQVTFVIGRFKPADTWLPTLVIYAAKSVDIPLFPGVVVRQLGIGLGVNAEVEGTTRLTLAQARKRLETGLPDVSQPASWTPKETDLTLLARAFVSPTKGLPHSKPELYVADLTIIVTSDFQFAVMGKLWLLTSLDHAQTRPFQGRPSAAGMMLLDGQEPSLRVVAQTRSDGLTTVGGQGVVGTLLGNMVPETRFAMEATPTGLAVVLGPNPIRGELGPLQVTGSSLLAFRSTPSRAYAISRSSLEARFGTSASMSFGLVSISASLRFGFSSELVLLGYFSDSQLVIYGRAHVSAYVEVNLHIRIGFRIRIGLPFGRSITISWHQDWDFNWQIHVDLDVELAVSSQGSVGLVGRARISVSVVGVSASLQVPVDVNTGLITHGRKLENDIRTDLEQLTGTPA